MVESGEEMQRGEDGDGERWRWLLVVGGGGGGYIMPSPPTLSVVFHFFHLDLCDTLLVLLLHIVSIFFISCTVHHVRPHQDHRDASGQI